MIKKIIRFKEVQSTQDTAKRFINSKKEVAIFARRQCKGRGRQGRTWVSPMGGVYLSLLLFPKKRISLLPFVSALTIVRVLEDYGFSSITINWPNDVLLNNKKVCGILCEQYRTALICGIGLNVNIDNFPDVLQDATSLRLESSQEFDLDQVVNQIIGRFNPLYKELQIKGIKVEETLNYITGIGEAVEVITSGTRVKGTIYGIDNDWALLVRTPAGIIKRFVYGDVRRLIW